MNIKQTRLKSSIFHILVFMLFCSVGSANAKDSATISYQKVSRNKVVFAVTVSSPAPASIIVQHFHSAGNNLIAASPQAQQIDNKRGSSKWLLKSVRPGMYPFSLTFSKTVKPSDFQLILRYRDPQNGRFYEKSVQP